MSTNKIRIPGYAQKIFYNQNIEWRPFSPNLVGVQTTDNVDIPLFTLGNFYITANQNERIIKKFKTKSFSNFISLFDIENDTIDVNSLFFENGGVKLNINYENIKNYVLFGSFVELVRVSLEDIILKWPASLYMNNIITDTIYTGLTFENYVYNQSTNQSTFKINNDVISNKFLINYYNNEETADKNLISEFQKYVVFYGNESYPLNGFTGLTNNDNYVRVSVVGNPFESQTEGNFSFHIKPNNTEVELFFLSLNDFQRHLLNRFTTPQYTSKFKYSVKSENGLELYITKTHTWPCSDGYNIDFSTIEYDEFIGGLLEMSNEFDSRETDIVKRFLVSESVTEFDTLPYHPTEEHMDTSGGKINKLLRIYGRNFDDINRYILGISFANTVTYNKQDNTPDYYIKNIARVLGWDVISLFLENNAVKGYLNRTNTAYSGHQVGYTIVESDIELWRRLILNTPWIWKSKGTRKAIEFLFKFIGVPNGLIHFNEYVYVAEDKIDIDQFIRILELNELETDLSLYPVDEEGYPKPLPNNIDMFYQSDGLWYRETGGDNSYIDILRGNNPHIGPYDGGYKYLEQFKKLIPDYTATTITSITENVVGENLFYNYNNGVVDGYDDVEIYVSHNDKDGVYNVNGVCGRLINTIVTAPVEREYIDKCGCPEDVDDKSVEICYRKLPTPPVASSGCKLINKFQIYKYPEYVGIDDEKVGIGSYVSIGDVNNCFIDISFDYLIRTECTALNIIKSQNYPRDEIGLDFIPPPNLPYTGCSSAIDALEKLKITLSLQATDDINNVNAQYYDVVTTDIFSEIGHGNLLEFFTANTNTGIHLKDDFNCDALTHQITNNLLTGVDFSIKPELFEETKKIVENGLYSNWANFSYRITDKDILYELNGKRVRLSFNIDFTCFNLCLVLDNLKIENNCTLEEITETFIPKTPGFKLNRIVDNKKSWVDLDGYDDRYFYVKNIHNDTTIRNTDYNTNSEKLILNTKEIELGVNYANAIETDVWCYVKENECIFTGVTECQNLVIDIPPLSGSSGTTFTFTTGDTSEYFGIYGTFFYEDVSNKPLPLTFNNKATWLIYPTSIQIAPGQECLLVDGTDFTPSEISSYYGFNDVNANGVPVNVVATAITTNQLWNSNKSEDYGRLNNAGIKVTTGLNQWIGFNYCLDVGTTQQYHIYMSADDSFRLKLNGEWLIKRVNKMDVTAPNSIGREGFADRRSIPYYSSPPALVAPRNVFMFFGHCIPITLTPGQYFLEFSFNDAFSAPGNTTSGVFEIYSGVTTAQLSGYTDYSQLSGHVVFSTAELRSGDEITVIGDTGDDFGLQCPENYILSGGCETPFCRRVISDCDDGFCEDDIIISAYTENGITGKTITLPCSCINGYFCGDGIDMNILLDEKIVNTISFEDFKKVLNNNFIDVKNRKTINYYATLKAIYERYINSNIYCDEESKGLRYDNISTFSDIISKYWNEVVEQVVPSTTIWGNTNIQSNTIFDQQKHKYRSYTTFFGVNPFFGVDTLSPAIGEVEMEDVSVETYIINTSETINTLSNEYNSLHIAQYNSGSEFIGRVGILNSGIGNSCDDIVRGDNRIEPSIIVRECNLTVDIQIKGTSAFATVNGAALPVTYSWSNGSNQAIISNVTPGQYTLTVQDSECCVVKKTITIG